MYTGVSEHRGKVQIDFYLNGERKRPVLPLEYTPANAKKAARMRGDILEQIELGTFNYDAFLGKPGSVAGKRMLFKDALEKYLPTVKGRDGNHAQETTLAQYRSAMNTHWLPIFGERVISTIKATEIDDAVMSRGFASKKTRNNCVVPLRGLFKWAVERGHLTIDPAARLRNAKLGRTDSKEADPFSRAEVDAILADMLKEYGEAIANTFEFAFFTGVRPSELIVLKWSDVHPAYVEVNRARVYGITKRPKSLDSERRIDLNTRSASVLERQRSISAGNEYVFTTKSRPIPYSTDTQLRRDYWNPTIKRLGLRHRSMGQTRHTYASTMLSAGVNIAYISKQLGHRSVAITLKVYAKLIERDVSASERNKLNDFLATKQPPTDSTSR